MFTNVSDDVIYDLIANGSLNQNMSSFHPDGPGIPAHVIRTMRALHVVSMTLLVVTCVLGVCGNTLTIAVICRNSKIRTVATCFILNLAIADNLFVLTLPFFAVTTWLDDWVFGSAMCKIMHTFYGVNQYASIFTMVLMSVDRYLAIAHPLKSIRYRRVKNAILICAFLWILCFVIMIPYLMYAEVSHGGRKTRCKLRWPQATVDQYVFYELFVANFRIIVGFILPITVMVICYVFLLKHLVKSNGPLLHFTRRPLKKVTLMVFVVTVAFIICWTPFNILEYMAAAIRVDSQRRRHQGLPVRRMPPHEQLTFSVLRLVTQSLVFISSCCNPFIYGISSRNFSKYRCTV